MTKQLSLFDTPDGRLYDQGDFSLRNPVDGESYKERKIRLKKEFLIKKWNKLGIKFNI